MLDALMRLVDFALNDFSPSSTRFKLPFTRRWRCYELFKYECDLDKK